MENTEDNFLDELAVLIESEKTEINQRTIRFSDAPWYIPKVPVLIGGAGGIGSWLSVLLARQDLDLYIYDFDSLELNNLGGQLFETQQVGQYKVDALQNNIARLTGNICTIYNERYDENSMSNPIVFSAFDNMKARKIMFEEWLELALSEKYLNKACVFIDGRLLSESGKVFTVTKHNYEEYRKWLWEDSDIADQPCTFKATSHASAIIAGLMVAAFNNYTTNMKEGMLVRETPFLTEFELPLMSLTITR